MSVKFESLVEGETLLDVHSERAGNTKCRRTGVWPVRVISVDREKRTAVCSWDGNRSQIYDASRFKTLRRVAPEWIQKDVFDARKCHYCHAREPAGHAAGCPHPRAFAKRTKGGST